MDVDNSASDGNSSPSNKPGDDGHQVNGLNNGYSSDKHKSHKSEHKDKHRDKDRDRDKSRSKDHKSSSKDKDKHRDKDKDRHSSHKSSSKDKDRDREKDKDRHRDKDKDKHKEKSSSSRDKDREKDKEKDREHKSSKEHKSSSRDKDKDREKDRDKHKHGSSKDKHKDKHRDKERGDKHSSSKDKKDKDRDKDREREKERKSDKYGDSEKIKEETKSEALDNESAREDSMDEDDQKLVIKEEAVDVKEEVGTKEEEEDDDDDDYRGGGDIKKVDVSAASSCDYNLSQFKDEPKFEAEEEESEDDAPLSMRMNTSKRKKESEDEEDEEDIPLNKRKKIKKEKAKKRAFEDSEEEEDYEEEKKSKKKKEKKEKKKAAAASKAKASAKDVKEEASPKKRKKKEEEQQEVWKWWEEEKRDDGTKWRFLEHKGPVFAPLYEPLPSNVKFYYDGKEMKLSEEAEEVAGFYARMLDHDYTTKKIFNDNFFKDWRKCMSDSERSKITDLSKCNFKQMHAYFMDLAEKNRNRTKEEKAALKEKNEEILKEYGFCTIDGHKEKIGNFKIEPPGLFRGRGEHPKMGMLKKRVRPEDVLINCSKDSEIPKPPPGHKWKEVRHDPNVTWLASWTENVQNQVKYVMLNPSSKLKGEKDWQKYETARRLHKCIEKIRSEYKDDWKSKEMRIRQRAVALYFIDRLALRAGNEKDEDQADTVGCCSLRVEHIELHEQKDDKEYVVVFDFLGKDSIRYYNEVPVEKRVFKNLQLFMENKKPGDDLFDRLNTTVMNKHLNELMEGLTAKVFRTYNASFTLQQQLDKLTNPDDSLSEKILSYNRANRAVAILCNHQRAVPKGHQKSMEKLKEKIDAKREAIKDGERQVKDAQRDAKHGSVKEKQIYDKKKKQLERLKEQLAKLEIQETDRDENKTIALGTSKLNYLDPRISVAWCKKYDVPIEKIYNKTQRDKFRWAIDMAGPDYVF